MAETETLPESSVVEEISREGLAELHTHLGGSVDPAVLWSLAHDQGIALPVKDFWDFDALVTTDQNLRYQQDLTGRRLAILVLPTTSWPRIRAHEEQVVAAINALRPGEIVELTFS